MTKQQQHPPHRRLSSPPPLGEATGDAFFQCVIVGSGFGGAVMAARLSPHFQPGQLAVLERGKEYQPGDFPATLAQVVAEIRTPVQPLGLFDLSFTPDMDALVGNGLGGTSNIYANVTLEPWPEVFERSGWPQAVTHAALKPYFKRVRRMLAVEKYIDREDLQQGVTIQDDLLTGSFFYGAEQGLHPQTGQPLRDYLNRSFVERPSLPKANYLRDVTMHIQPEEDNPGDNGQRPYVDFEKAPIAVNLTQYADGHANAFGVPQWKCTLCGDCVTGCNVGAKNTLVTNYLPLARQQGAQLFTQVEVKLVEASDRPDYHYRLQVVQRTYQHGQLLETEGAIYTRLLVLSAGVFGTVSLLLKSQQQGRLAFSSQLGQGFSGNADAIAISYNSERRLDSVGYGRRTTVPWEVGPTITAIADFRRVLGHRHIIQDGAFPSALAQLLGRIFALRHLWNGDKRVWHDLFKTNGQTALTGALNHSQVWLSMGYDNAEGALWLDARGNLRMRWRDSAAQAVHEANRRVFSKLSYIAKAHHIENPREALSWFGKRGATPITVHPLGGCCMADDIEHGVVDDIGRVFNPQGGVYPGLYVSDGSVCNASLGANPSLTIAALAERAAEQIIQSDLPRLLEER